MILADRYQLQVGSATAERIGSLAAEGPCTSFSVRGRNVLDGTVKTITLSTDEVANWRVDEEAGH